MSKTHRNTSVFVFQKTKIGNTVGPHVGVQLRVSAHDHLIEVRQKQRVTTILQKSANPLDRAAHRSTEECDRIL